MTDHVIHKLELELGVPPVLEPYFGDQFVIDLGLIAFILAILVMVLTITNIRGWLRARYIARDETYWHVASRQNDRHDNKTQDDARAKIAKLARDTEADKVLVSGGIALCIFLALVLLAAAIAIAVNF